MKDKIKVIAVIAAFLILSAIIAVVDYNNCFSGLGHNITNYNFDVLSIVIGNGVVVVLFVITFILLDRRNIQKEENKRKVALIMLKSIYTHCSEMIEKFDDHKFWVDVVSPSTFEKAEAREAKKNHFSRLPFFENNESILSFSQDGILHGDEIDRYIQVKKLYTEYIGSFWINESPIEALYSSFQKDELLHRIKEAREKIEEEITNDYHRKTLRRRH